MLLAKLEKYYNSSLLGSRFCSFFQDEKSPWPNPQEVPTYKGNLTTVYSVPVLTPGSIFSYGERVQACASVY